MNEGIGLVGFDWLLFMLSTVAAIAQYWIIAANKGRMETNVLIGRGLTALGWTAMSMRIGFLLAKTGDPAYPPLVLIAITLLASGSIIINTSLTIRVPVALLFSTPMSRTVAKGIAVVAVAAAIIVFWLLGR